MRYKVFAKFSDGRSLPSGYVKFIEGNGIKDDDNELGTIAFDKNVVVNPADIDTTTGKIIDHAVYLQAYDMASPDATNRICIMVSEKSSNPNLCEQLCKIARKTRNGDNFSQIILDSQGCMSSEETGDKFMYETNDSSVCPLVQVLEDFTDYVEQINNSDGSFTGSFRIRPKSENLIALQTDYSKKMVFSGCASGSSERYSIFIYMEQCRQQSVTASNDVSLRFYFEYDLENGY